MPMHLTIWIHVLYLVEVSQAEQVVLGIELEKNSIEALGGVVHGARVRWVKDGALTPARERDVNVALGNLTTGVAIAIHTHRTCNGAW